MEFVECFLYQQDFQMFQFYLIKGINGDIFGKQLRVFNIYTTLSQYVDKIQDRGDFYFHVRTSLEYEQ